MEPIGAALVAFASTQLCLMAASGQIDTVSKAVAGNGVQFVCGLQFLCGQLCEILQNLRRALANKPSGPDQYTVLHHAS